MSEHEELLARLDSGAQPESANWQTCWFQLVSQRNGEATESAAAIRSLEAKLEAAKEDGRKIGNFVIALINAISVDKTLPAPLRARAAEMKAAIDYVTKEPKSTDSREVSMETLNSKNSSAGFTIAKEGELTVNASSGQFATIFAKPNYTMTFSNAGGELGKLDFNGPKMIFTGSVEESAKVFFDWVETIFAGRLKELSTRRAALLALAKDCRENGHHGVAGRIEEIIGP